MVLTAAEALGHAKHTLSTQDAPLGMRILNDAGEYLGSCHHWSWLQGRRTNLHFEKDQGHVWLPRDFRDLTGYGTTEGVTSGFELTTHQDLIDLKTKSLTSTTWVYRGAVTYAPKSVQATGTLVLTTVPDDADSFTLDDGVNPPVEFEFDSAGDGTSGSGVTEIDTSASTTAAQVAALTQTAINSVFKTAPLDIEAVVDATNTGTVNLKNRRVGTSGNVTITDAASGLAITGMSGGLDGGRPEPRLDLWPEPVADLEDALTIYYRAGWTQLNEDEDLVSVPSWIETLYLQLVRAIARGYEREDLASMSQRIAEVHGGPFMRAAIERDAEMQPSFGGLNGGAVDSVRGGSTPFWNFGSTAAPA